MDSDAVSLLDVTPKTNQSPLGVRPSGNGFTRQASEKNARDCMGLFGWLPGALVLVVLEFFDEQALLRLGGTCRGLYGYCTHEPLWRDLRINKTTTNFKWRGSWRASVLGLPSRRPVDVDCSSLCCDALWRPFLCSQITLAAYVSNIPPKNQITRMSDVSLHAFNSDWSNKPFILTEPVKQWPIYSTWRLGKLVEEYGDTNFSCEAVDWPLKQYAEYMRTTQDESPLYLFDRGFLEKMNLKVGATNDTNSAVYEPPAAFQEDLFDLLGDQRPDHRWLIIGPARSGSTFHKDPNATSAWNAVVRGAKYWIMFPHTVQPPGVFVTMDESEVTAPLSIAEWLLSFHAEARATAGCYEGICDEGEVLHVPSGWWHLVVNLEPSIAITQNFVPRVHLKSALRFLRDKPDQVSGFQADITNAYDVFLSRIREADPDLAMAVQAPTKRKWEEVTGNIDAEGGNRHAFGFGFADETDEELA